MARGGPLDRMRCPVALAGPPRACLLTDEVELDGAEQQQPKKLKRPGRRAVDDLLIAALASGATLEQAARSANVNPRTVARRRADPQFTRRVDELRRSMVTDAAGRLASAMSAAADKLKALLASPSEGIQLRSAVAILEQSVRLAELFDLQRRVE